jgi:hypothetical protein
VVLGRYAQNDPFFKQALDSQKEFRHRRGALLNEDHRSVLGAGQRGAAEKSSS